MARYVLKRVLWVAVALTLFSFIAFVTIELPPGRFLTRYPVTYRGSVSIDEDFICDYEQRFALDGPFLARYAAWLRNILLHGDWGHSLEWMEPVSVFLYERFWLTLVLTMPVLVLDWGMAIPLGIALARHKGTLLDDLCTLACRVSQQVPAFLIAVLVMWFGIAQLGLRLGGLFSEEFEMVPWSWAKAADLLEHIWLPISILLIGSVAHSALVIRHRLLQELGVAYVDGARARGMAERPLFRRYPLRVALGQLLGAERFALTRLVSGTMIVAVVLSLQTTGPMFLRALSSQDLYFSGSMLLLVGAVCIMWVAFFDVLRAAIDPRLRTNDWQPTIEPVVGR